MRIDKREQTVTYTGIKHSSGMTFGLSTPYVERSFLRTRPAIVKNQSVNGFRAPSSYSCEVVESTVGRGGFEIARANSKPTVSASYRGGAVPGSHDLWTSSIPGEIWAETESLVNRSIIGARNNVANRTAAFGETIAEARSTLAGLAGNAQTVTAVCDDLINTNWKAALRKLRVRPDSPDWKRTLRASRKGFKSFGEAWLTYWFGLAPIVDDMVQGLAFFSGDEIFRTLRVKGSAYVPIPETSVRSERGGTGYYYGICDAHVISQKKIEGGVYTSLWYTIDSSKLRELTKFGLVDVPATAWALVPYSFAIDWVLPVSEVLRSLTATVGLTYLGGSTTRVARSEVTFPYARYRFDESGREPWEDQGSYLNFPTLKGVKMLRDAHAREPNPVDLWIKDPLDAWTATTALSLLAQRLKFFKT